jgi:hypothetical protein
VLLTHQLTGFGGHWFRFFGQGIPTSAKFEDPPRGFARLCGLEVRDR